MAWISSMSSSSIRPCAGVVDLGGATDQRDDLVEHVERLDQAPEDVRPALRLREPEAGPALDDLDLVADPVGDELVDGQRAGHAVDQGQHVGAEVGLQLGVLEQVVEHHPRDRVALEHDDEPLAGAAGGVVAHVGDALHLAGVGELGDLERQVVGVDHVGQLGDREAGPPLGVLVDLDHGALGDRAAAGAVGLLDALAADDQGAVGEVGALDPLDQRVLQLLAAGVGVLERPPGALRDLAQVVGRDAGGHADRDPGRAVDQQVGVARRQDRRLLASARRSWAGSRPCPRRCRGPSRGPAAPSGTRCTAWRRPRRCPASRSCPGRGPAAPASPRAARAGPGCRRSRCRRAGGTDP